MTLVLFYSVSFFDFISDGLSVYVLVVTPAELRQVGQLLDPDDGVVEGRLQWLGHSVGQDHRDHHRQDVGDLTGQFKHDDGSGHRVGDRSGQGCGTWAAGGGEIKRGMLVWWNNKSEGFLVVETVGNIHPDRCAFKVVNKEDPWVALKELIHQNDELNQLQWLKDNMHSPQCRLL